MIRCSRRGFFILITLTLLVVSCVDQERHEIINGSDIDCPSADSVEQLPAYKDDDEEIIL